LADGHGGYRKPTNPAPVSGPGAHSARTDGQPIMDGLGDGSYGSETAMQQIQGGAPMASAPGSPQGAPAADPQAAAALQALQGLTGLSEPSQRPGEPVTHGADAGPGADSSALGLPSQNYNQQDAAYFKKWLPLLIRQAEQQNVPPGYKAWVRQIIANLPQQ
jgi:hypothetical protein